MIPRRRGGRVSQIQRTLKRSAWRQAWAWLGPRWVSIAGAVALFALGLALLTSPHFKVEQVAVKRDSASAEAAVTRVTQLSQVVGYNIFLVNTGRVASEIAALPGVLSARVVPRLPNLVEIEIVERVPIAHWQAASGSFLVDDQGYAIAEAPEGPAPGLALLGVRDTTGRDLRLGDQVDQRSLLAARELAKALPAAGAAVREVEYSPQGLILITDAGWRVIFGDTDVLNAKLANFAAVAELARAQNLAIKSIDLRPRDRPFYQVAS